MHVAEDRREHDLALADALGALEELLEVRDGLLHHFGRLQHERQDQLAGAELVADFFHRRQQHVVEHVDRVAQRQHLVDLRFDAVLAPAQDRVVDAHLDRRARIVVDFAGGRDGRAAERLPVLDHALQRVGPAVEHEVVAQFALERARVRRTA